MKKPALFLCAFCGVLGGFISPALADTISLRDDAWCPYNCGATGDKPRYIIEIAKEVFGKTGHTVDYQILT